MTRLLLIDDEQRFARALAISLRPHGYEVEVATTGEEGLALAASSHPDVIVLDLGLPGLDGLEVLEGLRAWTQVPVLVLSARHNEPSKVQALDAGADDYVTKPFGMEELLARLRAAQRRAGAGAEEEAVVATEHFRLDLAAKRAYVGDEVVRLTPKEWQVVTLLVRNPGKLVSQRQLLQDVWGPQYETETDYLRVFLASIRRKLEPVSGRPRYFITEPGMGYRFQP
ncbi:MAG: Transcriptional regulatory protein KdpE [Actinomycetia bacterium]|nr:Transcriptional regulatory protein KdpE [Actinomycetes bacterium]